ncbi:MAG: hypothetical protein JST17_04865 [Bacteroidetes bacterium]|nr:hypothetical protein [Bacteroidota bacterium]
MPVSLSFPELPSIPHFGGTILLPDYYRENYAYFSILSRAPSHQSRILAGLFCFPIIIGRTMPVSLSFPELPSIPHFGGTILLPDYYRENYARFSFLSRTPINPAFWRDYSASRLLSGELCLFLYPFPNSHQSRILAELFCFPIIIGRTMPVSLSFPELLSIPHFGGSILLPDYYRENYACFYFYSQVPINPAFLRNYSASRLLSGELCPFLFLSQVPINPAFLRDYSASRLLSGELCP